MNIVELIVVRVVDLYTLVNLSGTCKYINKFLNGNKNLKKISRNVCRTLNYIPTMYITCMGYYDDLNDFICWYRKQYYNRHIENPLVGFSAAITNNDTEYIDIYYNRITNEHNRDIIYFIPIEHMAEFYTRRDIIVEFLILIQLISTCNDGIDELTEIQINAFKNIISYHTLISVYDINKLLESCTFCPQLYDFVSSLAIC